MVEDTNATYLAKQGWKILTQPNNIWIQLMKAKYLINPIVFHINKTKTASIAWKSILDRRLLLKKGTTWIIVNGRSINSWYDYWMDDQPLLNEILPNTSHLIDECVKANDSIPMSTQWSSNLLTKYLPKGNH